MTHRVWIFGLLITVATFCTAQSKYFYGNLHAHSDYSDGNAELFRDIDTPLECYDYASRSRHFDFLGISEHNHSDAKKRDDGTDQSDTVTITVDRFHDGLGAAEQGTVDDDFIALYGLEWGVGRNGHVLLYGIDSLVSWETDNTDIVNDIDDYQSLFHYIANKDGAFAYLAHPDKNNYGDLLDAPYDSEIDDAIVGVALRSGPAFSKVFWYGEEPSKSYRSYWFKLLKKGYHVAPGCDHDNHYTNFGRTSQTRLVVIADTLTKDSIMSAIRQRRFYASDDWNVEVSFTCNGQQMGSILTGSTDAVIDFNITDSDGEDVDKVKVYRGQTNSNKNPKNIKTVRASSATGLTFSQDPGREYYYLLEIKQEAGDIVWTAPIWYTVE